MRVGFALLHSYVYASLYSCSACGYLVFFKSVILSTLVFMGQVLFPFKKVANLLACSSWQWGPLFSLKTFQILSNYFFMSFWFSIFVLGLIYAALPAVFVASLPFFCSYAEASLRLLVICRFLCFLFSLLGPIWLWLLL